MSWMGIAFDTCFLRSIGETDLDKYFGTLDTVVKLHELMGQAAISMLLDYDDFIVGEYERNLPADSLGRKFFEKAVISGGIYRVSGSLTNAAQKVLTENGVDNDDYAFIGVAQTVQGIYVTTEAKHLAAEQRSLLHKHCGVTVASVDELPTLLSL